MTLRAGAAVLACWLSATGAVWAQDAPAPSTPPSAEAYLRPPAIGDASVSPDGVHLALIARADGKATLRLLSAAGDREIGSGNLDIRGVDWLDDTRLEISNSTVVEAPPILPRQRVLQGVSFDIATRKSVTLLDGTEGVAAMLTDGWLARGAYKGRPVVFLRGLSGGPAFALYRADPATGRGTPLTSPSLDAERWVVSADGDIRARRSSHSDGRGSVTEVKTTSGWRTLADDGTLSLAGLSEDGARVIVWRDDAPFTVSASDGALTPLTGPAGRPVRGLIFGAGSRLVGLRLSGLTPEYAFLQPTLAKGWPKLVAAFPGAQVAFVNASDDGQSVALEVTTPRDAGALYWADLRTLHADKVGDLRPGLPADRLGRTSAVELKARDGLTLPSVLTLPPDRPPTALPLVVLVGSSPNADVTLGFSPIAQAFAARGYAVLSVNTRGSALSPQLEAAGVGQLGAGMQTDITDAVSDLARRGVVDPKRVCIAGAAYGGYAALAAVTVQQNGYRCAMAVEPEVNLADAVRWPDTYTRGGQVSRTLTWRRMTGADAPGAGRRLEAASPLHAAARADAPVLLVANALHPDGADRTRRMRDALRAAGKPVEFVQLDKETGDLGTRDGEEAALTAMLDFARRNDPA